MKKLSILMAGASLWMIACNEKSRPQSPPAIQAPPAQAAPAAARQPHVAVPDTFKTALGEVYEGYTRIQTALAQDDLAKAKEALDAMHAVLHMMPKEGLEPAAKAYWDSADARIMEALHPMASAGSIGEVRAHFMAFSEVMVEAIGRFGITGEGPVYQFHCPMANDNQGADWLQKGDEPANPYFGKSMPKCGTRVRAWKG